VAGRIAVIDRGGCELGEKALYVEAAGAVGVVFVNSDPDEDVTTFTMDGGPFGVAVTLPAVMINTDDGDVLKAALVAGPVVAGINHEYPSGDWVIPVTSELLGQVDDRNPSNDRDPSPVLVTPGGVLTPGMSSDVVEAGDTAAP